MTKTLWRMPRRAYLSEKWLADEKEAIFNDSWHLVGVLDCLKDNGGYIAINAGDYALVVLRDDKGNLRAFHNMCSHRGSPLYFGRGRLKGRTVVCPYHNWSYTLDGSLRAVPNFDEEFDGLDKCKLGLRPATVDTAYGLLFVHAQENPPISLEEWLAPLGPKPWPHTGEGLKCAFRISVKSQANWKILMEIALDTYHLGYLHRRSLGAVDSTGLAWHAAGAHIVGPYPKNGQVECLLDYSPNFGSSPIPGVNRDDLKPSAIYTLFPTTSIAVGPSYLITTRREPLSTDRTIECFEFWVSEDCPNNDIEEFKSTVTAKGVDCVRNDDGTYEVTMSSLAKQGLNGLESEVVMIEDSVQVEWIQQSMRSPAYRVGALATEGESQLPFFHDKVLAALSD